MADDLKIALVVTGDTAQAVKSQMDLEAAIVMTSEATGKAASEATQLDGAFKAAEQVAQSLASDFEKSAATVAENGERIARYRAEIARLREVADAPKPLKQAVADLSNALKVGAGDSEKLGYELKLAKMELADAEKRAAGAKAGIKELGQTLKELSAEQSEATRASKADAQALKQSQAELEKLARASADAAIKAEALKTKLDQQREALNAGEQELRAAGVDVSNLAQEFDRLALEAKKAAAVKTAMDTLGLKDAQAEAFKLRSAYIALAESGALTDKQLAAARAKLHDELRALNGELPKSESLWNRFGTAASAALAGFSVRSLISSLAQTDRELSNLNLRIQGLTHGTKDYGAVQAAVAQIAEQHSKKIVDLTESEAALLSLEQAGLITRKDNLDLLRLSSDMQSKAGISAEQLKQSMYGLQQALASGTVHAEELNQVTEPIPGLLAKMDAAAGLAGGGLRKLVNEGKISSAFFKDVYIRALQDAEGSAEKAAGGIEASASRMSNAWTKLAKETEPTVTKLYKILADGAEFYAEGAARLFNSLSSDFKQVFLGLERDYDAMGNPIGKMKESLDQAAEAAKELKPALDATIDPLTGLKNTATVTADVLDRLKSAQDEAAASLAQVTAAQKDGAASGEDVAKATAAKLKAEKDYQTVLAKSAQQTEDNAKLVATEAAVIEASGKAREEQLKRQFEILDASAKESKAAGDHAKALELENQAIDKAAELKRAEINNAEALIDSRRQLAEAAQKTLEMAQRAADADGELDAKKRQAIATAKQDVAAKNEQTAAAQSQLEMLLRFPPALGGVKTATALTADQLDALKNAAEFASRQLLAVQASYADGKASAADLGEAHVRATGALKLYTEALQGHGRELDAAAADAQRETGLVEKQYAVYLQQIDALKRMALARGDDRVAAQLGIQIAQTEAQQAYAVAAAKQAEADASKAKADALAKELAADGALTTADQALIEAAKDNAKAMQLEADAAQASAAAKSANAQASEQAATANKKQAQAADQTAQSAQDAAQATDSATQALIRLNGELLGNGPGAVKVWVDGANEIHRNILRAAEVAQELQKATSATDLDRLVSEGEGLAGWLERSSIAGQDTAGAARQIRDAVKQANDQAKQLRQSLEDTAAGVLAGLQNDLALARAQAAGASEEELKQLQERQAYEERRAALAKQQADADRKGAEKAAQDFDKAISELDELHSLKMKKLQEQQQAAAEKNSQSNQMAPTSQPTPTQPLTQTVGVVEMRFGNGGDTARVLAQDQEAFLRGMQRVKQATVGRG